MSRSNSTTTAKLLRRARELWDAELSELDLRAALGQARAALTRDGEAAGMLESVEAFARSVPMSEGFGFEGYDPVNLPVEPMSTKFETVADGLGYVFAFVAAQAHSLTHKKAPFRHHGRSSFIYERPAEPLEIALLSDFGNGLTHSRYIARHLTSLAPAHLLYLGDVYYAGTSREFANYVAAPLEGLLDSTNVMMLNSNHEMFSRAVPYLSYLDYRKARSAAQLQEASYFCLRFGDAFQLIGLDTDYFGHARFEDRLQRSWLGNVLRYGREKGAVNVLLTANEPFEYGTTKTTTMLDHLSPFLRDVDLWFWGNTHYCGFFDASGPLPLTSCIGHGGYPYKLAEYGLHENPYRAPCPARPLFLETESRYRGTKLRPELGNNGFVMMHLEPTQRVIRLEYLDWMKKPRFQADLGRRDGTFSVLSSREVP